LLKLKLFKQFYTLTEDNTIKVYRLVSIVRLHAVVTVPSKAIESAEHSVKVVTRANDVVWIAMKSVIHC